MKRKSGLMSSLGYGAAGTARGRERRESGRAFEEEGAAAMAPKCASFSANGTSRHLGEAWPIPCPMPKGKRGSRVSTWKTSKRHPGLLLGTFNRLVCCWCSGRKKELGEIFEMLAIMLVKYRQAPTEWETELKSRVMQGFTTSNQYSNSLYILP